VTFNPTSLVGLASMTRAKLEILPIWLRPMENLSRATDLETGSAKNAMKQIYLTALPTGLERLGIVSG